MKPILKTALLLPFCLLLACAEEKEEWVNLLSGETVNTHWKGATNRKGSPSKEVGTRWELKDGVLSLDRKREGRGGSIETKEAYFDFELKFEFCIQKNCNSGIKYRLKNSTGFEYQIIDDKNYRDNKVTHRTAEIYELQEEEAPRVLNPAGEWNTGKIIAKGDIIQHWLNGEKVLEIEVGSEDWDARFKKSKYFKSEILDFGTHTGPIHIQDHSDTDVTFRKMLIRTL